MKTWRWLCLLPLFTEDILASLTQPMNSLMKAPEAASLITSPHAANALKVPAQNLESSEKIAEGVKGAPFSRNPNLQEEITLRTSEGKAASPGSRTAEENCPDGHLKRRSLVALRRRGCLERLGSGLLATANGMEKAGTRLKNFDKLTTRQKMQWFQTKTVKGAKRTASVGVSAVVLPFRGLAFLGRKTLAGVMATMRGAGHVAVITGKTVGKGVLIAGYLGYKAGSGVIKLLGRMALHTWRYFGKGLAATGRGLQKAGKSMETQSSTRLAKKVPSPLAPPQSVPHTSQPPFPHAWQPNAPPQGFEPIAPRQVPPSVPPPHPPSK